MTDYKKIIDALYNDVCRSYYDEKGKEFELPVAAQKAAIDAIRAIEELTEWIPVTERLPEADQKVLWCGKQGARFLGKASYFDRFKKEIRVFAEHGHSRVATHWKPLPEPPKEEEDDES